MRTFLACLFCLVGFPIPVCTAWSAKKVPDQQTLASLERRAAEASPRDQCYLYAELVHDMVEYSVHEYASGHVDEARSTLKRSQQFTHKIQTMLTDKVKKIKRAQILLRRAAFRLTDLLHLSRYGDRKLVQETLTQVERAQQEAMMQVFKQ